MRPGSKLQSRVVSLSSKLPEINKDQKKWAKEKILEHKAFKLKNGRTACLDCGHTWNDKNLEIKKVDCPSCGTTLKVEITRKLNDRQVKWIGAVNTLEEFQLNEYWEVHAYHKVGKPASISFYKIVEQWIIPGGKWEVVARRRTAFNAYYSQFGGDFTLRHRDSVHRDFAINPWGIYPKIKVHDIYKRNGFKNSFHSTDPFNLFKNLLSNPHVETLLKAKQYSLMRYCIYNHYYWNEFWPSVKIAIRNNYIVTDSKMWIDYLKLLQHFKKDLRNPKYILPENVRKEHDKFVEKKRVKDQIEEAQRRLRYERERAEKRKKEEKWKRKGYYEKQMAPYLDLLFKNKDIEISLLQSVKDFKIEGNTLNHCVHTNAYWAVEDTLCFSARVNGERTETIQFSLKNYQILQCYGSHNRITDHHSKIKSLFEKNIGKIRKIHIASKKQKKKSVTQLQSSAA